jgi:hypothetical protein
MFSPTSPNTRLRSQVKNPIDAFQEGLKLTIVDVCFQKVEQWVVFE